MSRLTRRWTLLALLLIAVGAGALVPTAGAAPAGATRLGIAPTRITVTATEFKYVLSKTRVTAGTTVIFTLVNKGKVAHNFRIAGKTTATIRPGTTASITVTFKKAGKQAYLCTLPGHGAAGMKGVFTVTP